MMKGRQLVVIENLQLLELLELGDGEGDVSIQQVERQIPARTGTSRAQLKMLANLQGGKVRTTAQ
jgi:hypothetical protein